MKPTLLILAAGMGSRYGSLKQIDNVGPNGETIIDYSIYDAITAGFGKIVFVIRRSIEKEFKKIFDERYNKSIKMEYVFQELDDLPDGYDLPGGREKPWGACHAVLMGRELIKEPFAVINADDFYGREAFLHISRFLQNETYGNNDYCMVGYILKRTLSDHGFVTRAICNVNNENFLTGIVEREKIGIENNEIVFLLGELKNKLSGNETVSMNIWGFKPSFFKNAMNEFKTFLNEIDTDQKKEFNIPFAINRLIRKNKINLKVYKTEFGWFGVTYKEDKKIVESNIRQLITRDMYPEKLWI